MLRSIKSSLALIACALWLGACGTMQAEGPDDSLADLIGARPSGQAPEASYQAAKEHLKAGRFGKAAEFLQVVRRQDPHDVAVLNALGVTYDQLGRHDLARKYFVQGLALAPDDADLLNNIGYSYLKTGDLAAAKRMLAKARETAKGNAVIKGNLTLLAKRSTAVPEVVREDLAMTAKSVWIERTSAMIQTLVSQPDADTRAMTLEGADPAIFAVTPVQSRALPAPEAALSSRRQTPERDSDKASQLASDTADPCQIRGDLILSNGNGRDGMAARLGEHLAHAGYQRARLTNADHFGYRASRIEYGPQARCLAKALDGVLPVDVDLIERSDMKGLRLLLGRDLWNFDLELMGGEAV